MDSSLLKIKSVFRKMYWHK